MSPPYLSMCGIYLPFQVNLHVPLSKPSSNNLFCMLEPLMWWQGAVSIFHARRVILDMCLFTITHEKGARNWNVEFHAQIAKIIANETPPGLMLVWTASEYSASRGVWLIGGGGVKTLLFCLGTAYSMSSMEDTDNSWSLRWQWKHATQNYYLCFQSLSSGTCANQCFPLHRAYLFMFLLSHPLLIKSPIREHLCHFYALLLIDIEYDYD